MLSLVRVRVAGHVKPHVVSVDLSLEVLETPIMEMEGQDEHELDAHVDDSEDEAYKQVCVQDSIEFPLRTALSDTTVAFIAHDGLVNNPAVAGKNEDDQAVDGQPDNVQSHGLPERHRVIRPQLDK